MIIRTYFFTKLSVSTVLAGAGVLTASAAVFQVDFSDASGAYSGTNAPAATGSSTWINVADPANNSFTSGGLTFDLGRAQDTSAGTVSFRSTRNPEEVSATGSSIFGTTLSQDAMTSTVTNGVNPRGPLGVAINSLASGTYNIYVVAHYAGNTGTDLVVGIGTLGAMPGIGTDSAVFGKGTYAQEISLNASNTTSWQAGNNYALGQVTIGAGQNVLGVYIGSLNAGGTAFDSDQATLSSIQIVSVPEPSSAMLAALATGLCFIRRRR